MADTKISALASGNPAQTGDELPIARSGSNYKVTAGSVALLTPAFTSVAAGLVPASGGGTANYLRADGAFAAPPGGVPAGAITTSGLTMATARLLGRTTASTGAVEELTAAQVATLVAPTRLIRVFTSTGTGGTTWAVNSSSYTRFGVPLSFTLDVDYYLFTQYRISLPTAASEVAQTVKLQLHDMGIGAVISAGDDLTVTNSNQLHSSAWITRTATLTGGGIREFALYGKGSNTTVDLSGVMFIDVELRV